MCTQFFPDIYHQSLQYCLGKFLVSKNLYPKDKNSQVYQKSSLGLQKKINRLFVQKIIMYDDLLRHVVLVCIV